MVNLFFNWYEHIERQHEIDLCLQKNKEVFDNVIVVEGRPTFSELFALTNDYPNDVNCFCNSDIYFPSTEILNKIKYNECWALSRYDIIKRKEVLFARRDSQDSWIFRGVVKNVVADFTKGKWGCDNRLAYEIQKSGYNIHNPSMTVKTIHVHSSNKRNHVRTSENVVPPPYLVLDPNVLI